MANPLLSVSSVSKSFSIGSESSVEVLRDITFDVHRGEVVALLGPSGCGKSTLLRMIAGLESTEVGQISMEGEQVIGPGPDRGMVFQSYTSFDWMSVQQNVEYGLKLRKIDKVERKARAGRFIDLVGLTKFRQAYPAILSGGMRQRVAIARTLAAEPDLVLMDEPFGALDAETRWTMQELLLTIVRKTHATALIVTHDLEEAIFLADRIVFLAAHPGRIQEVIVVNFKESEKVETREKLMSKGEYVALQSRLMAMMRMAMSKEYPLDRAGSGPTPSTGSN